VSTPITSEAVVVKTIAYGEADLRDVAVYIVEVLAK